METRTKSIIMWTVIACLCFFGIPFHLKGQDKEKLEEVFHNYTRVFNKSYDETEAETRFTHFENALEKIQQLNAEDDKNILLSLGPNLKSAGGDSFIQSDPKTAHKHASHKKWRPGTPKNEGYAVYGLTDFADMSEEEFKSRYLRPDIGHKIKERERHHKDSHHHHHHHNVRLKGYAIDDEDNLIVSRRKRALSFPGGIPDKVDWRTKGVITPILHQKACGACWAFSTVETVESMRAIQRGALEPLSIQYLIDCATNGNMGCDGGDTCGALSWMEDNKLIPASQYPLTLQDGTCKLHPPKQGVQINSNYTCDNYVGAENQLLTVLAHHGPVAAAVDATNWQFYVGGVIQWNCDANNNHAVQIVGYDNTAKPPHYIVRNSWGTTFGDNGYLYVAIGSNLCGIANEVSSLSVK